MKGSRLLHITECVMLKWTLKEPSCLCYEYTGFSYSVKNKYWFLEGCITHTCTQVSASTRSTKKVFIRLVHHFLESSSLFFSPVQLISHVEFESGKHQHIMNLIRCFLMRLRMLLLFARPNPWINGNIPTSRWTSQKRILLECNVGEAQIL